MASSNKTVESRQRTILWIDVETTDLKALDPQTLLLEVACCLTTASLEPLAAQSVVIHYTHEEFAEARWSQWSLDMHRANGLWDACLDQRQSLPLKEAERVLVDWLQTQLGPLGEDYVAPFWGGCSTWLDRTMIERDMPHLAEHVFYRTIDASMLATVMELWANWQRPAKNAEPHRAMWDARNAARLALPARDVLRAAARRARVTAPA